MIHSKKRIASILFIFVSLIAYSQKNPVYEYGDGDYLKGLELYEKEKYGAARQTFTEFLQGNSDARSEIRSEANYYRAMSAVELRNDDSEHLVFTFISEYPESPHVDEAAFRLADFFYDKKSWAKSVSWYNRVDRYKLDGTQLSEYYFKKGYSYYMRKDYEEARVNFYEIQEVESTYNVPAVYYYSHIHYVEENYETALMGFKKIDRDPMFSEIAPYYITQILFMQKKYDEVISYAPTLLDAGAERRVGEISKIIGESYFMKGQYTEAIPYLEAYREDNNAYTIHDRYQLAFAYYSNQEAFFSDGSKQTNNVWIEDLSNQTANLPKDENGSYQVSAEFLLKSGGFAHLNCSIVRTQLYLSIKGMDENIRYECDRDIYLRVLDSAQNILYNPVCVSKHHIPDKNRLVCHK